MAFDDMQRRCPRLGGSVSFSYCRMVGEDRDSPCTKVFDCWWEYFDVVGYFQRRLSKADFERLRCAPVPNKAASLVSLIKQAQKRTQGKG